MNLRHILSIPRFVALQVEISVLYSATKFIRQKYIVFIINLQHHSSFVGQLER